MTHINQGGSERHWTNEPDGKLRALSTNKIRGSPLGTRIAQGDGTWSVSDEGEYCVDIRWRTTFEKWCSVIFRGEGDTYYRDVVDDQHKIVFAK